MRRRSHRWGLSAAFCALVYASLCGALLVGGCGGDGESAGGGGERTPIVADTTFLADIAQNVAKERYEVSALLPQGTDPHSFEPTPRDGERLADSAAVIINVTGLVPRLDELIAGAGGSGLLVIEAAAGIEGASVDPHVWLDPTMVIGYANNIAAGLSVLDPEGAEGFRANAEAYSQTLRELDAWIQAEVKSIPEERRLLVTNHESLGYFARRYGFRVVGTIFSTVAGAGSPSAQQLSALVGDILATGAPAIFLETGSNPGLARQIAEETGAEVVTDLYTASLGEKASTYVEMMRWNVGLIVEALR